MEVIAELLSVPSLQLAPHIYSLVKLVMELSKCVLNNDTPAVLACFKGFVLVINSLSEKDKDKEKIYFDSILSGESLVNKYLTNLRFSTHGEALKALLNFYKTAAASSAFMMNNISSSLLNEFISLWSEEDVEVSKNYHKLNSPF